MISRGRNVAALLLATTLLLTASRPARAGEDELVVAPSLAYSVLRADGAERHGGAVYLDIDLGLTDSWSVRWSGHYSAHAVTGDNSDLLSAGALAFGALYTIDVLKVVPYISLSVGVSALGGAGQGLRWNCEMSVGIGIDYLVSRSFSVGLELRYQALVPDIERYPLFLGVGVRLAWRRQ
ncbi:MAG: hypothetical protein ABI333_06150 [bacterium]